MKSVSKVQFGRLNDKRFYFRNGIMSLPYGHPSLKSSTKEKQKQIISQNNTRKNTIF